MNEEVVQEKSRRANGLKRKPISSPGNETRRPIEEAAKIASDLSKGQTAIVKKPEEKPVEPVKFEAMTFKCSPTMADILLTEGNKVGGVRVVIARFLKEAGHDIPEEDLSKREVRRTDRRQRRI